MSDLISRSAVINLLCELHIDNIAVNDKRITEYVREIPTAYDVDKVVKELEEPTNYTIVAGKHFTTVGRAIEIVKGGGVNEQD